MKASFGQQKKPISDESLHFRDAQSKPIPNFYVNKLS